MGEREESLSLHPNECRGPDRNSTVMCKCSEEASILTVNSLGKRSEAKQDAQYGVDLLCKLRAFGLGGSMSAKSRIVKPSLDGVCVHCSRRNGRQQSADSQAAQPASYPFHQRPSCVFCLHSHLDPHGGFDVYVYGPVWILHPTPKHTDPSRCGADPGRTIDVDVRPSVGICKPTNSPSRGWTNGVCQAAPSCPRNPTTLSAHPWCPSRFQTSRKTIAAGGATAVREDDKWPVLSHNGYGGATGRLGRRQAISTDGLETEAPNKTHKVMAHKGSSISRKPEAKRPPTRGTTNLKRPACFANLHPWSSCFVLALELSSRRSHHVIHKAWHGRVGVRPRVRSHPIPRGTNPKM